MIKKKIVQNKLTTKKKLTTKSIASRPRKEAFLPADAEYLRTHSIKLGKLITKGTRGEVWEVANNKDLVVKTPKGVHDTGFQYGRQHDYDMMHGDWEDEADLAINNNLDDIPLAIPTKIVNLGSLGLRKGNIRGMVRPRVAPVFDYAEEVPEQNIKRLNAKAIETIRQKLITLSYQGYMLRDGLQIGLDKAGRPLLFDMGHFRRSSRIDEVFEHNNDAWDEFLDVIGKGGNAGLMKYGEVTNGKNSLIRDREKKRQERLKNDSYYD
jgi:hypothetical protein